MEKRGGEGIGTLPFLMITFQRDGFQVLRKTFLDCKSGKRLGEDFHLKGKFKKKYIDMKKKKGHIHGMVSE